MAAYAHRGKLLVGFILVYALVSAWPVYAALYVLGDSLSDVGALGFTYTNPANMEPPENGQVWPQYLSGSTSAYCNGGQQCPFDGKTFYYSRTGNNYAVGGAGITFDSTDAKRHPNYTGLGYQITALVNAHVLTSNDVIAIWIGANDILKAAQKAGSAAGEVRLAAQVFRNELSRLISHANGARIHIFTIPDLGKTPAALGSVDAGILTNLSNQFNQAITASLPASVYVIDANAIFVDLRKVMALTTVFCRRLIDPQHVCGKASNQLTPGVSPMAAVLFADPLHPSIAAHRELAKRLSF